MRHLLTIFLATYWLTSTAQTLDLSDTIAARQQMRTDLVTIKKLVKSKGWTYDYIHPKFFDLLVDSLNFSQLNATIDTATCDRVLIKYTTHDFDPRVRVSDNCHRNLMWDDRLSAKDTIGHLIITQAKKRFDVCIGACFVEPKRQAKQRFIKTLFGTYQLVIEVKNKQAKYYFRPPPSFNDKIKVSYYSTGKF